MVKGVLLKKSLRDMKRSLVQFISIFIMASVAVSMLAGLDSIWKTVQVHSAEMYKTSNLSDLWISIINPTEKDMWAINEIKGIGKTEKRFVIDVQTNLKDEPSLKLYTMNDKSTLDKPYITSGSLKTKSGAILDKNFAKANHLKRGDSLRVEINDKWIDFKIEALGLSSENIFSIKDSTELQPDSKKYGFITVDEEKIKKAYGGEKIYNQVAVKYEKAADDTKIKASIDKRLGDDLLGIITRKDNRSVSDVDAKIVQFKTMAAVFPFMFFVVTALVTLSTMSRLVEEQRNQIGTLKALGYSKKSIIWHYTSYGVYVGVLGAAAGALIGPNFLGKILMNNFQRLYVMYTYTMVPYIPNIVIGTVLIILCTAGIACYSCIKIQNEMPAVLLRTKQPKKGNHIFLERIPSVWNRLKFSQKLIARNTMKNKGRMLMSVLGIMGCSGLIIAALTLNTTMKGISKIVYEEVYSYDNIALLDSKTTDKDIYNLHIKGITQDIEETVMQAVAENGERRMAHVSVLTKNSPLFHLSGLDGKPVVVPDEGILITRKLAETLHIEAGDKLALKKTDDSYYEVEIKQVIYMVSGQGIYMARDYWEALGENYKPTSLFIKWQTNDYSFLKSDYVKSQTSITEQKAKFDENLKILFTSVAMLISSGGILAFVVLYNLGVLNFYERVRDLATLKVLGFYKKEISSLVLMENIVSAVLGILAGVPLGGVLVKIITRGFGESLDLISVVKLENVLMAGGITFIFVIIVNVVVQKKINTIDMLEALKSVE